MLSKMVCVCGLGLTLLAMQAGRADAQAPPMDMSWAIQSQMAAQYQGDMAARQAAMTYLAMVQQYRAATGYTGPLPSPVSPESLQRSVRGAIDAGQDYIHAQQYNSMRRSNAVNDYAMRGIRGCWMGTNIYGQFGYICP